MSGIRSAHSSALARLAAAIREASSSSPSLRSVIAETPARRSSQPSAIRARGATNLDRQLRGTRSSPRENSSRHPAAPPTSPVRTKRSPARAPDIITGAPSEIEPNTVTFSTSGPLPELMSPPAIAAWSAAAASTNPSWIASTASTLVPAGRTAATTPSSTSAPIAARSEAAAPQAFTPT